MDKLVVGLWGAFFGVASLALGAALLAFTRSVRRVALSGALAAALSALYALVFLGWVPMEDGDALLRVQAHLAAACAAILGLLLLSLLGLLRVGAVAVRSGGAMAVLTAVVLGTGWLLPADEALGLATAMEVLIISIALVASVGSALRGARTGWLAVAGVACMSVAVAGLSSLALAPESTPWGVQAASALAATIYVACMALAMWGRYAYLIEVRKVMVHGPNFDPVTRLPSHAETGVLVGEAFDRGDGRPVGVMAVSISNLHALEQLHGRAAYNHGLFVCASRLRRAVPPGVELGRLREDAFLLVMRKPRNAQQLIELAHLLARRLAKPVALGISRDMAQLENSRTEWVADVGVGLMLARPGMRPPVAVAGARAMSRTAWSYPGRVAWYDEYERQIAELPAPPARAR
jgi:GGDEF domain-containing protein